MATKAKESSSVVGKEKKGTSSTKKTPTTTNKRTSSPSPRPKEKHIPNYLKPTISSGLDSNDGPTKATINRRRSLDPLSSSRLPKQTQVQSLSRQNKGLVSPGPRERKLPLRTTAANTNPSKPVPERFLKTPKGGRTQPLVAKTSKKITTNNVSTSTSTKKGVATRDAANSTKVSNNIDTIKQQVKEAIHGEGVGEVMENVENQEEEEDQKIVDSDEHGHDEEHGEDHDEKLEESDEPHAEDDGEEKVIPTVLEKEDENTNEDECNISESQPETTEHSTTEEEVEVKEEEEGGVVVQEDNEEEKEGVDEEVISEVVKETREGEGEDEHVQVESGVKKEESTEAMQEEKKEAADEEEDTAKKQLEAGRNGVRALAGAFQNVIDHQKTK